MKNTALKIPDKNIPKIFDRIKLINSSMPRDTFDSRVERIKNGQPPKFDPEAKYYLSVAVKVRDYESLFSSSIEREKRYLSLADDDLQNLEYRVLVNNLSDRFGTALGRLEACIGREAMMNENQSLIFIPFEKPSNQSLQDICIARFDSVLKERLTEEGFQTYESEISKLRQLVSRVVLKDTYHKLVRLASNIMTFELYVDVLAEEAVKLGDKSGPLLFDSRLNDFPISLFSVYSNIYYGIANTCFDYSGAVAAASGHKSGIAGTKRFITATEDAGFIAAQFSGSLFPAFPEPEIKKENDVYTLKISGLETEKIKSINAFLALGSGKNRINIDLSSQSSAGHVSVHRPFSSNGTEYLCEFAVADLLNLEKAVVVEIMPSFFKLEKPKSQEYRI